jgi:serine/threonine-protein kinase
MKRLIKISLYVIIISAVGMFAGHITFKLLSFSRTVTVPELKGKGMVDANSIARSKGLYIRLDGEDYDSNVPQGYIIRQDIPSGNKVKEGREIRIVLSKGPKVRYVPDVVGQPFDAAEAMLREKGIKIGRVVYAHADKTDKNIVLAQRPEPNERGGDSFSLLVSLGDYENK